MIKNIFLVAVLFSLLSCHKDKATTPAAIPGYTARDAQGNLIGNKIDNTDWQTSEIWSGMEQNLMLFQDTIDYSGAQSSDSIQVIDYPNPFKEIFNVNVTLKKPAVIKLVIVDESFRVYNRFVMSLHEGDNSFALYFDDTFPNDKLYRLYYEFLDKDKKVFAQGHGDVLKQS